MNNPIENFQKARFSHILSVPVQLDDPSRVRVWVEWRGLALASPQVLEPIEEDRHVQIAGCWMENGVPMLKLTHPVKGTQVDYCVRWLMSIPARRIVLLELAPGWVNKEETGVITLVEVIDQNILRTLTPFECLRFLSNFLLDMEHGAGWDPAEAESIFGRMPDNLSPEFRAEDEKKREASQDTRIFCHSCSKPVGESDSECPNCGVSRIAPPCPKCGRPVTNLKSKRAYYRDENGTYPWHYCWDGRCAGCGFEFAVRFEIETGHHTFFITDKGQIKKVIENGNQNPFAGMSSMEIRGDESIYMAFDEWDYQPTIEVRVKRLVAANMETPGALSKEERIVMTIKEWEAIIAQLQGPLKILMERRPWNRDTT
jgi:hypothetical protein